MQSNPKASIPSILLRRRTLVFFALVVGFVFYCAPQWGLPASLKEAGFSGRLSRANIAQLTRNKKVVVDEIYGLLHVVTSNEPENEHVLSSPEVDPTQTIDWSVYAAGMPQINWANEAARIDKDHPIIVFSKSYCPYSRKAKELLRSYDIVPAPKVIEVDLRDDGDTIKSLLARLTGHSTFPNIIIQGKSIGGADNLMSLHATQELRQIVAKAGAEARSAGSE